MARWSTITMSKHSGGGCHSAFGYAGSALDPYGTFIKILLSGYDVIYAEDGWITLESQKDPNYRICMRRDDG